MRRRRRPTWATQSDAVISVPTHFNDAQRQATKDAGAATGLSVHRLVNEPVAAALAYGLDEKGKILVFHLGGGTFDTTVLDVDNGVFEAVASSGDPRLGGDDFDRRVVAHFIEVISEKLSVQQEVRVEVEALFDGVNFSETLTRARFEELGEDLFLKTIDLLKKALEDAELDKSDIDEIIIEGGSTRIPKVHQLLTDFFDGREPNKGTEPRRGESRTTRRPSPPPHDLPSCQDSPSPDVLAGRHRTAHRTTCLSDPARDLPGSLAGSVAPRDHAHIFDAAPGLLAARPACLPDLASEPTPTHPADSRTTRTR
ncbi:hypothetical protein PR202_gb29478 [Eleusine coracana subsp. coracana]|uniref:Uncharacterized protein n=1 Tax=Eleusine coracana subsp. coracana TaxID=191504 RepID=A0AAV5G045_ELECO|nr:hypothetical protein PR202_gb29478 [Eleusine coracana subsp. coracana]